MRKKQLYALVSFLICSILPVWGGTYRPRDGMLSFLLLLGFLLVILGVLQLLDSIKSRLDDLFEGMF